MINVNDRYFNLIVNEWFIISEGPFTQFRRPFYKVLWEDGIVANWGEEEIAKWLNDHKLNIKVNDDKHLLSLKLKYSDKEFERLTFIER